MVHTFTALGQYLAADVNSGAVHVLDEMSYRLLSAVGEEGPMAPEMPEALAEQLQANLALGLEPGNRRQCKKSDGVYLMEHIGCTGVLVECGFLSNYEEEQRLLQPEYQKKLAAVIAGTLSVWLSEEHPNEI